MDPTHQGNVFLKGKGVFQRWQKKYCAVYTDSKFGVARLEVYPTREDFGQCRKGKHVMLSKCMAVRTISCKEKRVPKILVLSINNDSRTVQFQMGCVSAEEAMVWQDGVSRAAFPDNYAVVIQEGRSRRLSVAHAPADASPLDERTYDTPWDVQQIRVLLIPTASSKRLGIAEGTYVLAFGAEAIMLKHEMTIIEAWDYKLITWFGYGDKCCGFQTEGNQCFEFKCAKPDHVYERLRTQVRLQPDPDIHHCPADLELTYYARYIPMPSEDYLPERPRNIDQPITYNHSNNSHKVDSPTNDKTALVERTPKRSLRRSSSASKSPGNAPCVENQSITASMLTNRSSFREKFAAFGGYLRRSFRRKSIPEDESIAESEEPDEWHWSPNRDQDAMYPQGWRQNYQAPLAVPEQDYEVNHQAFYGSSPPTQYDYKPTPPGRNFQYAQAEPPVHYENYVPDYRIPPPIPPKPTIRPQRPGAKQALMPDVVNFRQPEANFDIRRSVNSAPVPSYPAYGMQNYAYAPEAPWVNSVRRAPPMLFPPVPRQRSYDQARVPNYNRESSVSVGQQCLNNTSVMVPYNTPEYHEEPERNAFSVSSEGKPGVITDV